MGLNKIQRFGIEMKILFIAHYFQPEPNFFVGLPFAKELRDRGHQVQVLTGLPNYPGGKIYDGYKVKLIQREVMDGIEVIRMPLYPSHDRSSLKRILSYMSLSLAQALIGTFAVDKADVAFVSQGPATIGLPAKVIKLFRRIPFVYNIQDLWPDTLSSTGMFDSDLGMKLLHCWCKSVYKSAAKIAVITPGMKRILIERGVPADKIEVIYNWCDDSQIVSGEPSIQLAQDLGMKDKFNILFAGNIGKAQAMDAVLDAAKLIKDDCPNVQFVLMGGGVEAEPLKQKAEQMQIDNVKFLARRPVNEVGPILRLADVLMVHLRNEPLFEITIPSKTQAYMAAARPVLIGVKGDASDLILKANAGLACQPENAKSIADTVRQFAKMPKSQLNKMGENGKNYYYQNLSFGIGVDKYEKIFNSIDDSR